MSDPLSQLQDVLKANSYSLTTPRKAIFAALQHQEPQTMHEIILACKGTVDRASVYRTITLFEQFGVVQRLQVGWKYRLELSDAFHDHHHHMHCVSCGRTTALPEDPYLEKRLQAMAKTHRFQLQTHQLELSGICQSCQKITQ